MASDVAVAMAGPDAFSEKKLDDTKNDVEPFGTGFQPATPSYTPADELEITSEDINYHTLTWWYVRPIRNRTIALKADSHL
jgi:hypothetical protein